MASFSITLQTAGQKYKVRKMLLLIKFAEKENLGIVSLNTLAPSLEDVFLTLVEEEND